MDMTSSDNLDMTSNSKKCILRFRYTRHDVASCGEGGSSNIEN